MKLIYKHLKQVVSFKLYCICFSLDKLSEFNEKVGDPFQVHTTVFPGLSELIAGKETVSSMSTLKQLLKWPKGMYSNNSNKIKKKIKNKQK